MTGSGGKKLRDRDMKLYVLRERWGNYVISSRAPGLGEMPPDPIEKAGVGFDMITWGDWGLKPFSEKVIIYNFFAKYAIDHLGFYGPKAVTWINSAIARGIAYEARWALWRFGGLLAVYAGVMFMMAYYSPDTEDFIMNEVAPIRYLMRYNERVFLADLRGIDADGKPRYYYCDLAGDVLIGEKRRVSYPLGPADHWDTGFAWVQRRGRFMNYESWSWSDVFVEYIGLLEHLGDGHYHLKAGYRDPYVSELPPGFANRYLCREWNPEYRMP